MPPEIEVSEEAKDFMRRLLDKDKYSRMTTREAAQHKWLRRR
jgi:serine/threonine protein kinase